MNQKLRDRPDSHITIKMIENQKKQFLKTKKSIEKKKKKNETIFF